MVKFIENIGSSVINISLEAYDFALFFFYCIKQMFLPKNYSSFAKRFLLEQIYLSGIKYLFSFILLALLFGSLLIFMAISFALKFNLLEQFGTLIVFVMINEFTPLFTTGFFILTYSLASKEKIEIIKKEKNNMINEIYLPKLINSIFILPLLSLLFVSIMLSSGYFVSSFYLKIDLLTYKDMIINSIELENLLILLIKSSILGFVSILIPIYFGHKRVNTSHEITKSFIRTLSTIVGLIIIVELFFALIFY